MKLRIRDNSVRLRLERSEVEQLRDKGLISAHTNFPGGRQFKYVLESSPASVKPGAFLSESVMTVRLPESTVFGWANSEQVAITGDLLLDEGDMLRILVEKDFACLAPRDGEDETDMFPHPAAEQGAEQV